MQAKPHNPYPLLLRRVLRRALPHHLYRRHIGRHEDESLRLWTCIAREAPPEQAILDIGAFHGDYAKAARQVNPKVQVYAFEPNPHTLRRLEDICKDRQIEIVNMAVGEENGTVAFLHDGATSRIANGSVYSSRQMTRVPTTSLDAWIAERSVIPYLLKIDVEGLEARVLRGAQDLLTKYQPVILCEVLTDAAGIDVKKSLPYHYRFFHIDENNGVVEKTAITRKKWRNHNWLLMPESRCKILCSLGAE